MHILGLIVFRTHSSSCSLFWDEEKVHLFSLLVIVYLVSFSNFFFLFSFSFIYCIVERIHIWNICSLNVRGPDLFDLRETVCVFSLFIFVSKCFTILSSKFRRRKSLIYEWFFFFLDFFTWAKNSFLEDGCGENILIYMVLDRLEQPQWASVKIKNC